MLPIGFLTKIAKKWFWTFSFVFWRQLLCKMSMQFRKNQEVPEVGKYFFHLRYGIYYSKKVQAKYLSNFFKLRLGASRSRFDIIIVISNVWCRSVCLPNKIPNKLSKQSFQTSFAYSVSKQTTRKNLLYFVWKLCKACLETLFGQLVWKELHYHLIILNAV